jgi:hypothetical protein
LPLVLRHEFTREVIDKGREVQDYEIGDRMTVSPLMLCMRCAVCFYGKDNLYQEARLFGVHLRMRLVRGFPPPKNPFSTFDPLSLRLEVSPRAGKGRWKAKRGVSMLSISISEVM